jgi:hypothetical protein
MRRPDPLRGAACPGESIPGLRPLLTGRPDRSDALPVRRGDDHLPVAAAGVNVTETARAWVICTVHCVPVVDWQPDQLPSW